MAARSLSLDVLQMYADATLVSMYGASETTDRPSLVLHLSQQLRMHAGSHIQVG